MKRCVAAETFSHDVCTLKSHAAVLHVQRQERCVAFEHARSDLVDFAAAHDVPFKIQSVQLPVANDAFEDVL